MLHWSLKRHNFNLHSTGSSPTSQSPKAWQNISEFSVVFRMLKVQAELLVFQEKWTL